MSNATRIADNIYFTEKRCCVLLVNDDPFCFTENMKECTNMMHHLAATLKSELDQDPRTAAGTVEYTTVVSERELTISKQSISRIASALNGFKRTVYTLKCSEVPAGVVPGTKENCPIEAVIRDMNAQMHC